MKTGDVLRGEKVWQFPFRRVKSGLPRVTTAMFLLAQSPEIAQAMPRKTVTPM